MRSAFIASAVNVPAKGDRKQLIIDANTPREQTFRSYVFSSFTQCVGDYVNAAFDLQDDEKIYFVCLADDGSANKELATGSYEGSADGSTLTMTLSNSNIELAGQGDLVLKFTGLKTSGNTVSGAV